MSEHVSPSLMCQFLLGFEFKLNFSNGFVSPLSCTNSFISLQSLKTTLEFLECFRNSSFIYIFSIQRRNYKEDQKKRCLSLGLKNTQGISQKYYISKEYSRRQSRVTTFSNSSQRDKLGVTIIPNNICIVHSNFSVLNGTQSID